MSERFTVRVDSVVKENTDTLSLRFARPLQAKPGQFVMLSDLQSGEKPFSLSECDASGFTITFRRVGPFTNRLFHTRQGDYLSIRGAYGSSFFVQTGRALVVGGGCAAPPLYLLCRKLVDHGCDVTVVNGARTSSDLLFGDRFRSVVQDYLPAAEDGPDPATAVDSASEIIARKSFDTMYAGGPESMLYALLRFTGEMDTQFLIERYMKCAIGVCGSCTMDATGLRACVEGPVLHGELIAQLNEFGRYRRDSTGKRIPISPHDEREECAT